jgi:hypothetical protein
MGVAWQQGTPTAKRCRSLQLEKDKCPKKSTINVAAFWALRL